MPELVFIQSLAHDLQALGLDLPEQARTALDVQAAALTAASATPTEDLRADAEAGTLDPATIGARVREAALALNARAAAHEVARELIHPLQKVATRAVMADADRIVKAMRPAFDTVAAGIAEAAARFDPDTSPERVIATGPEATAAYRTLDQHRATLDRVHAVRATLTRSYGYGATGTPAAAWYVATFVDFAQVERAQRLLEQDGGPGGQWLRLASAGYRLRLNTATEAAAVLAKAHGATDRAQRAAEQRSLAEHRRQYAGYLDAVTATVAHTDDGPQAA